MTWKWKVTLQARWVAQCRGRPGAGYQQRPQPWDASVPNCRKAMRKSWNERSIAMSNWLLVQALA